MMLLPIFCLLAYGSAGGQWKYVRLGPPEGTLNDYVLRNYSRLLVQPSLPKPTSDFVQPSGWNQIESRIQESVQGNILRVITETLSNGDRGLDAILRNIVRLQPQNAICQQVIDV